MERNYDFKQKRLKNFISQLHLWLDVMEENLSEVDLMLNTYVADDTAPEYLDFADMVIEKKQTDSTYKW